MTAATSDLNFTHRAIRDLAWALLTPPLFETLPDVPSQWLTPVWREPQTLAWLKQLDQQPEALLEHLKDQRATRLGVYFEQLLSFYFAHFPRFKLLAKNLQANDEKRTIGEYDFIVWDEQQLCHYHIEVAVKFYIGLESLDCEIPRNTPIHNWHLWVGPNKKDTLGIKMNHLLKHQLRLSETEAGQKALETLGLKPEQLEPKLLLTGRLYYPEGENQLEPPYASTPSLERQRWLYLDQLSPDSTYDYIILPRQLWMSPISIDDRKACHLELITSDKLASHAQVLMTAHNTPLHIAAIDRGSELEDERFFLI